MANINLKGNPFNLTDEDIKWVNETKGKMTIEEKIGQLFFLLAMPMPDDQLAGMIKGLNPGGMMYRPSNADELTRAYRFMNENSKIPMFFSGNLEKGGNGLIADKGTYYGSPLAVGATKDEEYAYKMGKIVGREASAVGGNMTFAPIIDINYNFRNPITNTRSFGDDPETVSKMGIAYTKGTKEHDVAVTIKHFPGDGVDSRDQHLVTTINALSYDEWMETYGKAYKENIDAGARGLMVGHISLPAFVEKVAPNESEEVKQLPATLSPYLVNKLLREELGYNGLTMTDATLMTGFGQWGKREDLVPQSIANGCDMFLFTRNPQDDFMHMMKGYQKGIITDERLDEALTRILALKASIKLHTKTLDELVPNTLDEVNLEEHKDWAKDLADKSITLVKDTQSLLPLNPEKHKKIGIIYMAGEDMNKAMGRDKPIEEVTGEVEPPKEANEKFVEKLEAQGFEVSYLPFDSIMSVMMDMMTPMEEWSKKYDAVIYLMNVQVASNQTSLRPTYKAMGFDAPWFVHEMPVMLVSLGSPYHAFDFPMVKTEVNTYCDGDEFIESVVEKITGKSEFKGTSPVDLRFKEFGNSYKEWLK